VTTLPTFTASYTTKSGFRVGAFTSQRHSAILFFLQDCSTNGERILISSAQLAQFQTLVEQTRKNLDLLRTPR
jgi:folylpolyglutamate synthase/dihydropteroate synthase